MDRYVIMFVNCVSFDSSKIIQVYVKKLSRRNIDKCFYLTSNETGCSSDNDMTFDTFRNILSSMKKSELMNLKRNISGDKEGIVSSMLDNEFKRRRMSTFKNFKNGNFDSMGLVKASQLQRGK